MSLENVKSEFEKLAKLDPELWHVQRTAIKVVFDFNFPAEKSPSERWGMKGGLAWRLARF